MTRNKIHAFSLAAALVVCGVVLASIAPQAGAQGASSSSPQSQKIVKTQFEVLHMLYQSLQVRSIADMRELHTFTYSPAIRDKMQKIFNDGGYQYGDNVVVWYQQGTAIALNIKGKPSKAK
jgi:hypothetical protein